MWFFFDRTRTHEVHSGWVHSASQKHVDSFLSGLYCAQHCLWPYSRYLMLKSCDLHLGRSKVIHSQRSQGYSIAHVCFSIRLQLTSSSYLSPFSKFWCALLVTWTRTAQGHPRSNVMVPIDCPCLVSYSTSIDSSIISVTVFEILDADVLRPRSRMVHGHPGSKISVPIDSPWAVSYSISITTNIVSHNFWDIWH